MRENNTLVQETAQRNWDRARRRLWLRKLLRPFCGASDELIPFERVQKELRLIQGHSHGVQEIALDRIRGSVGRYQDFTSSFLPRKRKLRQRWKQIDALSTTQGFPPITVYKVGDAYFVLDGNHRVSVALQAGMSTIEAHVLAYSGPVGLSAHADLDELLIKAEETDFLTTTGIERVRPEHGIVLTAPGRYRQVKYLVKLFQEDLTRAERRDVPWDEALARWIDDVYRPVVREIETSGVLEEFPGRTAADLFVWMWKHKRSLDDLRSVGDVDDRPGLRHALRRLCRALWKHRPSWLQG